MPELPKSAEDALEHVFRAIGQAATTGRYLSTTEMMALTGDISRALADAYGEGVKDTLALFEKRAS